MRNILSVFGFLVLSAVHAHGQSDGGGDFWNPYNLTDCRNQTAEHFERGGKLRIQSWHIHYTTNESDFARFYYAFLDEFSELFPPSGNTCPFGPNYGLFTYKYVCSLEDAPEEEWALERIKRFRERNGNGVPSVGGSPWTVSQRAFFIPVTHLHKAWTWAQENVGYLDLLLHPNTGCMNDDHSLRSQWVLGDSSSDPVINTLYFPCNMPATGCNDTELHSTTCACDMPVASDSPEDSCVHCTRWY